MNVTGTCRRAWAWARRLLPVVPAAMLALLPTLSCPGCWPTYAAVVSALGLGALLTGPYAPHLTAAVLLVALLPPAARIARGGGGVAALLVGIVASILVLIGKFLLASTLMTYGGGALLMVTPFVGRRNHRQRTCPTCVEPERTLTARPLEELREVITCR